VITLKRKAGLMIFDVLCINIAIILSFLIIYGREIPANISNNLLSMCIIFTIINIIINYVFQLYNSLWRYASVNDLIMIIMSSVTAALTAYLVSLLIAKHTHIGVFFSLLLF